MKQTRKAELQRKLSMMRVPSAPPGLAERIKADIPDDLSSVTRVRRFSGAFTLQIAASLLAVVVGTSAFVIFLISNRGTPDVVPSAGSNASQVRAKRIPIPAETVPVPSSAPQQAVAEPTTSATEAGAASTPGSAHPVVTRPVELARTQVAEADQPVRHSEAASADRAADVAVTAASPAVGAVSAPSSATAAGGVPAGAVEQAAAAPPAAPLPALASAPAAANAAGSRDERRVAMKASRPPAASVSARAEMFGISVDPFAFDRVQKAIENGERPPAREIDVEAIVSYLGSPAGSPATGVSFDVESSREPDVINSRAAMIRFTIDTPRLPAASASIGSDANLDIRFNNTAVATYRILGHDRPLTLKEPLLFDSASVTAIIEVTLNDGIAPYQEVATLTLRYRDANRHVQTIQKRIRASDLQRSWEMASLRHRLATLGAIWGESLKTGGAPADVAKAAKELATDVPGNDRARELAEAASAAAKLEGGGADGSDSR